jgi:hypothetical protein
MMSRLISSSPRIASILVSGMLLAPLIGCGQSGNSGGTINSGAVVADEVEAANKAAEAAYAAEKGKKK